MTLGEKETRHSLINDNFLVFEIQLDAPLLESVCANDYLIRKSRSHDEVIGDLDSINVNMEDYGLVHAQLAYAISQRIGLRRRQLQCGSYSTDSILAHKRSASSGIKQNFQAPLPLVSSNSQLFDDEAHAFTIGKQGYPVNDAGLFYRLVRWTGSQRKTQVRSLVICAHAL